MDDFSLCSWWQGVRTNGTRHPATLTPITVTVGSTHPRLDGTPLRTPGQGWASQVSEMRSGVDLKERTTSLCCRRVEQHQPHRLLTRRYAVDHSQLHHIDGYDLVAARHRHVGDCAVGHEAGIRLRSTNLDALHGLAGSTVDHHDEGLIEVGHQSITAVRRTEAGLHWAGAERFGV